MRQCQRSGQVAERPFRLILGALLLGFAAIRISYQRRASRGAEPVIRPEHDQNMVAHASMLVIGCAMAIGYLRDARWMRRFTMSLPAWIRWIGACLALAALLLLRWAHGALGTNFSSRLQVRARHTLVTTGPYRWIRHPIYTGFLLFIVGCGLLSANVLLLLLSIIGIGGVIASRIAREEALMEESFPGEYQAYKRRTGPLLPALTPHRSRRDMREDE